VVTLLCVTAIIEVDSGQRSDDLLILRNADRTEITLVRGEAVATLIGNVIFDYNDLTTYSDKARWWRDKGTVRLSGNVRMLQGGDSLTCDRMTFYKGRKLLEGVGRVDYRSPSDNVRIHGRKGRYDLEKDRFVLTGDPHFLRFDTAAAETLTIVGVEMVYEDSLGLATARRNVRITKGRLAATCDRASYATDDRHAKLRGSPHITYDAHSMDGDSVDLFFSGDTLEGVSIGGHAHGIYRESEGGADTNVTNVWSDSMYLRMTPKGGADSLWAWGDVISTYYLSSAEHDSANRVTGKAMVLAFQSRQQLRNALVWGNARSSYYVQERDGSGRNDASGDTIQVFFDEGQATEIMIHGSVRGAYYPDSANKDRHARR